MATNIHQESDRTARRAAIERASTHYPGIGEEELHGVLHCFRRDAFAMAGKAITVTFVCMFVLGVSFLIPSVRGL